MKVLSLFDGMSCCRLALDRTGFEIDKYYASEVDKYAIQVTIANFPDTIQIGDVRDVNVDDLPVIDLLAGGSPCFVSGTKVLTTYGYTNIEDVKVGDYVLTHKNNWKKVLDIGGQERETLKVKSSGFLPITTTKNHPFFVRSMRRKWDNEKRTSFRFFEEPEWKKAGDLKRDDFVSMPIIKDQENVYDLTLDECFVLGRYIADGHTRKDFRKSEGRPNDRHWQLILSIGNKKNFKTSLSHSLYLHTKNVERMIFSNKRLVEIAEKECGSGALNKRISPALLKLPKKHLKSLLDGVESGDGSMVNDEYRITTVSEELAKSIQLAVAKVYRVGSMINFYERPKQTIIEGRVVNQNDTYTVSYRKEVKKQSNFYTDEDHIWYRWRSSEYLSKEKVYNIEVDGDNSYTADNCVVHNCQNFSFAGTRKGMTTKEGLTITDLDTYLKLKGEGFEFEGQSYLFWEYVRIYKELKKKNPNLKFLLENVVMSKQWEHVISRELGIEPILINSALVSAQNRRRLYWTNIYCFEYGLLGDLRCEIPQPEDKGILLKDVLEDEVDEKYFLSEKALNFLTNHSAKQLKKGNGFKFEPSNGENKGKCLTARCFKQGVDDNFIVAMRGRNPDNPSDRTAGSPTEQRLEPKTDGKTNCLTTVQKDNLIVHNRQKRDPNRPSIKNGTSSGGSGPLSRNDGKTYCLDTGQSNAVEIIGGDFRYDEGFRWREGGKSGCDTTTSSGVSGSQLTKINSRIRRLIPIECERLQTVPDNYTNHVSDTQRYKMLGNGWTIDVIAHIFSYLNK